MIWLPMAFATQSAVKPPCKPARSIDWQRLDDTKGSYRVRLGLKSLAIWRPNCLDTPCKANAASPKGGASIP